MVVCMLPSITLTSSATGYDNSYSFVILRACCVNRKDCRFEEYYSAAKAADGKEGEPLRSWSFLHRRGMDAVRYNCIAPL